MTYCRALKFDETPNIQTCIGFFQSCMNRHQFDGTVFDYTWKQNRLAKDKEALKSSLMSIINKKPKKDERQNQRGNDASGYTPINPGGMTGMDHPVDRVAAQQAARDKRENARGSAFKSNAMQMLQK